MRTWFGFFLVDDDDDWDLVIEMALAETVGGVERRSLDVGQSRSCQVLPSEQAPCWVGKRERAFASTKSGPNLHPLGRNDSCQILGGTKSPPHERRRRK